MGRQLWCCALQLDLDRINPLGKDFIPGPGVIEAGDDRLHAGGVETVFKVEDHTEFRAGSPTGEPPAIGRGRGNSTPRMNFNTADRRKANRAFPECTRRDRDRRMTASMAAVGRGPRLPAGGPRTSLPSRDRARAAPRLPRPLTRRPGPRTRRPAWPPGATPSSDAAEVNTGMAVRPSGALSVTRAMSACLSECSGSPLGPAAASPSSASWARIGTNTRAVASAATTAASSPVPAARSDKAAR